MTDILIRHVTAITVDAERRVIEDAAIAVTGDRITAIGPDSEMAPLANPQTQVINADHMAALPGLIDCHSHAGHGLVRSLGTGDVDRWFDACEKIYATGSTVDFWRAEARLALLERLMSGVTTCVTLLGGGHDIMRTDDPTFGEAHCSETQASGLRTILAVGPNRRPFPKTYRNFETGSGRDVDISFERQMEVSEALIDGQNDLLEKRTGVCLILPVYSASEIANAEVRVEIAAMADAIADLRASKDVLFTQDGHREGSIAAARDLDLIGSHSLLSHSVDLTEADIVALKETGATVVHNPSAIMSIYGRCPAPELIGDGVRVVIGSDAGAPDRGFDMFRHMKQCMLYHRRHFRDPSWMPPGKVLEMATIDAAHALGVGDQIGSLETGKKADIVLVDMRKPHLYPSNMPLTRLTHFANAADVDTVVVNGKLLMQNRQVLSMNIEDVLEAADTEIARALERSGLENLTEEPRSLWSVNQHVSAE